MKLERCPPKLRASARRALVLHIRSVSRDLEGCVRQALEIDLADESKVLGRLRGELDALLALMATPEPTTVRQGWDPKTIRRQVEGEFRESGARVWREEDGR